jgi:hypothetical protein
MPKTIRNKKHYIIWVTAYLLGTFVGGTNVWVGTLVCIELPWAPIEKLSTFVCTFFIFHLLPLHFLCPTINARIVWAIIKVTCEIIYSTCSKSSWGGTLIEAQPISLMVCLETHSL